MVIEHICEENNYACCEANTCPPDCSHHSFPEQPRKPIVKLIGEDGNVFNLIGLASKALKRAGQPEQAAELTKRAFASGSYDEVLNLIQEYCEVE